MICFYPTNNFSSHHPRRMSFLSLHLSLPSSFKIPAIFNTSTPEQNELILTAGVHALETVLTDSAGHNQKSLKQRMEEQHLQSESSLKQQHAVELKALKTQLATAQATAESARAAQAATVANAAQAEADARKRAQDGPAEQIRRLEQELKTQRERAAAEREDVRKTAQDSAAERILSLEQERDALAKERKRLLKDVTASYESAATELKAEREKLLAAEREASKHAAAELKAVNETAAKQIAELQARLERAQGIKSCPALKGGANESVMTDVLTRAFGGDFLEKQLNAGDHLLRWEGYKLMIEDKAGYEKSLPKKEIDKAHDDFVRHKDCDLMMFICADGIVPGHTKPGDFDIGIHDGRPVLYVGRFGAKEDKVLYLQTLQPVIRELIKLTKKAGESGLDASEALAGKLSTIRLLLKNHESQVAAVRNSANAYARTQKSAWEMHKMEITKMEASFASVLSEALSEDVEEPVEEESVAEMLEMPVPVVALKKCGACKQLGHTKAQTSKCPLKGVTA